MGRAIQGFPLLPSHDQTVVLVSDQFTLTFTFRERTNSWYLDLRTVAGVDLVLGVRLSVKWSPTLGLAIEGLPAGALYTRGPDGYVRGDLGDQLRLMFYELSEIPIPDQPDQPTVVIAP